MCCVLDRGEEIFDPALANKQKTEEKVSGNYNRFYYDNNEEKSAQKMMNGCHHLELSFALRRVPLCRNRSRLRYVTPESTESRDTYQSKRTRTQRDPGFFIDSSNLMIRSATDVSKIASNKIPVPRSVTEALSGPYAEEWSQAIQSELASHAENETWTLVDKPQNCNVIGSMWVFKVIYDQSTGSIDRFKARLVARGDSQQRGINYDVTYAPVARFASFRADRNHCAL